MTRERSNAGEGNETAERLRITEVPSLSNIVVWASPSPCVRRSANLPISREAVIDYWSVCSSDNIELLG